MAPDRFKKKKDLPAQEPEGLSKKRACISDWKLQHRLFANTVHAALRTESGNAAHATGIIAEHAWADICIIDFHAAKVVYCWYRWKYVMLLKNMVFRYLFVFLLSSISINSGK